VAPFIESLTDATRIQIAAWTFWRAGSAASRWSSPARKSADQCRRRHDVAIRSFHPRLVINQGPRRHWSDSACSTSSSGGHGGLRGLSRPNTPTPARARTNRAVECSTGCARREERLALPVFPGDPDVLAAALAQPYDHGRVLKGIIGSAFQFNRRSIVCSGSGRSTAPCRRTWRAPSRPARRGVHHALPCCPHHLRLGLLRSRHSPGAARLVPIVAGSSRRCRSTPAL